MLNELYQLSRALEHHGLLQSTTHPNVHAVGKGDCLLFQLNRNGIPMELKILSPLETATLWKHSKGNHNSFPAIRVQKPLLSNEESNKIDPVVWKKAKIEEKIELLTSLNFDAVNADGLDIKITDWTLEELAPVLDSEDPRLSALKQLITVFPRSSERVEFQLRMADFLKSKIPTCSAENEISLVKELLIGSWNAKQEKFTAGCMTYYDVYESEEFQNLIISPDTYRGLVELLNKIEMESVSIDPSDEIISPFTGKRTTGIGDKYPNPNLPKLGQTYLYSKKSDTPCLTRYYMGGTEAFQAGKQEVQAINDAIAFLTDESRKNKTWRSISDSNREKPNLLLAYLTDDPQNDAYLASILGDPSDYTEEDYREEVEPTFEVLCEQVLGEMDKVIQKNPDTEIKLIVLETLDPGRKQVVYGNSWTAEQFRGNLLAWAEAAKNHPDIIFRIRNKKEIVTYKPQCPGPDEICRLLKLNYTRSGSSRLMKQSAATLHEIYQLYMPQNDHSARDPFLLEKFVTILVDKASRLLGDLKHQMIIDYSLPPTKEATLKAKRAASFIALISIVLWRLDVRKEAYMFEAPYNVGQFLQLADMLHKHYCVQVRNGGDDKKPLPAQLIGNEMLNVACEYPVEALIRLKDRMKVYLAWATTVNGEGAKLAKWILARFGEVCKKIASNNLPERFTPAQQAQVLLGYLATIPYEKKSAEENKNE